METLSQLEVFNKFLESQKIYGEKLTRSYKRNLASSLLLLLLSLEIVKPSEKISVEWFDLSINFIPLVYLLSWVVLLTQQYCFSILHEFDRVSRMVHKIAKSFKSEVKDLQEADLTYFAYPDTLSIAVAENILPLNKLGRVLYAFLILIITVGFFSFPFVAEISAYRYLLISKGFNWIAFINYLIIFLIQITLIISLIKAFLKK